MAYALITGASSGIGREMAALFAADRHDLIITARSQGKLDDVSARWNIAMACMWRRLRLI